MWSPQKLANVAACVLAFSSPALAEQGVTDSEVQFAQIAAFEGPAAALGTGMRDGLMAAFEEANAAGGVHGRMLRLDTFDDGYEPDQSVNQLGMVLEGDDHIALIGPVGTPTTSATQPMATEARFPMIGAFTGAGFLRDASLGNVFNLRASYHAETEAWIAHLVDELGMTDIAILYQDDGFGRVGLAGVTQALERRGLSLVAEGTYVRNTVAVRGALLDLRRAEPDAVVMVGAYKPIAEFIRLSRQLSFEPTFVNISFVGSKALSDELGPDGEGVIISQVVPFPWDASQPVVARYQAAMSDYDPDAAPDFITLEGYLVGRMAIAALEAAGPDLTRETYLATLGSMTEIDVDGLVMQFGPDDNQALDTVFLTRMNGDGSFSAIPLGGGS